MIKQLNSVSGTARAMIMLSWVWGARLAWSAEHATLDLGVVGSSPMLRVEIS